MEKTMDPFELIANAAHQYSDKLPRTSADRALLFSRRYGFAAAAIHALEKNGFCIVTKDAIERLSIEGTTALTPVQAEFLNHNR
jgi:7-keto-8-aminopelargonate synthetase-like enzyme